MTDTLHVDDAETPTTISAEGVEIYDRGDSLLLSTERLRETPGPDGILMSVDGLQNLAVEVTAANDHTEGSS
ncbi:hypothetical protein [Haloarcula sp. JP-L23]|uniref:hypothetical protein n=1 Tax=Haloarcula sp. JP-L23 TaxID=2716717 RepID=UPI00140F1FB5|nr:hypothetical protein G9465_19455 [Haloarcula sp. JP-L23]